MSRPGKNRSSILKLAYTRYASLTDVGVLDGVDVGVCSDETTSSEVPSE